MIKFGSNNIGKIYLGSNLIGKAYLGSNLVYQKGGGSSLPYTPLTYIQSDGTAYINTGITGNQPKCFEAKALMKSSNSSQCLCGCRQDSGDTRFMFAYLQSNKNLNYGYTTITTGFSISTSLTNDTPIELKVSLKYGTSRFAVKQQGDSDYSETSISVLVYVNTQLPLYLFATNNYGTAVGGVCASGTRLYFAKIYDSSDYTNLVFDGIPCIYQGQYGLWDNVTDTFFGNAAGSGAFTGQ